MRILIVDDYPITLTSENKPISIPDNAAITITTCCGDCDWCVKASMGRKPACGHPRIQAARPYAEKGEKGRSVEYETRPDWCPL